MAQTVPIDTLLTNTGRGRERPFLEGNLAIVKERWPKHFETISSAEDPTDVAWSQNTPQSTLVIDGIHLSSGYDQEKEAQLQASLIPEESETVWVYGMGVGDLPRALLRRQQLNSLFVTLLNPSVAHAVFACFDQRDWLADPRVELDLVSESDIRVPFAAVPSCLQLADENSARLRDLVFLELATPFLHEKHSLENPAIEKRIERNTRFVAVD